MHRTQVYLTDLQYRVFLKEAKRLHSSLSELIRNIVHQRIVGNSRTYSDSKKIIGLGKSKSRDVGRNHDKYLY